MTIADGRSLWSMRQGNAAVEFAIVAPVLAFVLIGVSDYGLAVSTASKLDTAARAGAHYAAQYPTDTAGAISAAMGATNDTHLTLAAGSPSFYCTCGDSGAAQACATDGSTSCVSPARSHNYISVTVKETYQPLIAIGGFGGTLAMSGSATIEVP